MKRYEKLRLLNDTLIKIQESIYNIEELEDENLEYPEFNSVVINNLQKALNNVNIYKELIFKS